MVIPKVYLASNSPRRRELLDQIGVRFDVLDISIPEDQLASESPADYVQRLSIEKAAAGKKQLLQNDVKTQKKSLSDWQSTKKHATIDVVIGSDTAVVCEGEILGKPQSPEHARQMLRMLSGRTHEVFTGVAINSSRSSSDGDFEILSAISRNLVTFRQISEQEIERYIATNEGHDKAGGYAIQGLAVIFIEQLQGSYSAVMGLPLFETAELLKQAGVEVLPVLT